MSTRETTEKRKQPRRWRQWSPEEAKEVLAAWRASGLPLGTFARQQGQSAERLRWWKKRLGEWNEEARGGEKSALVPVVVSAPASAEGVTAAAPPAAVVVRVPGGAVVEVAQPGAVEPEWLAAVVRQLGRVGV
jgi:hypothetical protein